MAETEIKWVHSFGWQNRNPEHDLGGSPSIFEISSQPMNNLFDNITPEQASIGHIDYRCFYIVNKRQDGSLTNVTLTLTDNGCGEISIGAKQQNEEQYLTFIGPPTENGFVILKTEFGPPFTCVIPFDGGSPDWSAFAGVLEAGIQTQEFCGSVTVDPPILLTDGAKYRVAFDGDLKNKKIELVTLVQNSLTRQRGSEYRVAQAGVSSNHTGDTLLKVHPDIDAMSVPEEGLLWIFNPGDGVFEQLWYIGYSTNEFVLANPLPDLGSEGVLGVNDEVWVEMPEIEGCVLNITRKQAGFPVGQTASIISRDIDQPSDWEDAGGVLEVGLVRPKEGFFIWVMRAIDPGQSGCEGSFELNLTADVVDWPYTA